MRFKRICIGVLVALACQSTKAKQAPQIPLGGGSETASVARKDALATRDLRGLVLPVLGTQPVVLGEMEGRAATILISASFLESWSSTLRMAAELDAASDRDQHLVIVVTMDPEFSALGRVFGHDHPPFLVGWDPQGALILRLGLAVLPAAIQVDGRGRVLRSLEGFNPVALEQFIADAQNDPRLQRNPAQGA